LYEILKSWLKKRLISEAPAFTAFNRVFFSMCKDNGFTLRVPTSEGSKNLTYAAIAEAAVSAA
jgi:hypothetical protein